MVELILYPTEYVNVDGYVTPENGVVVGGVYAPDVLCARKSVLAGAGYHYLLVKTFKDSSGNLPNIPVGSIVDSVVLYLFARRDGTFFTSAGVELVNGFHTFQVESNTSLLFCAGCSEVRCSVFDGLKSVFDLNNETYVVRYYVTNESVVLVSGHFDLCWLEINYHSDAVAFETLLEQEGMIE